MAALPHLLGPQVLSKEFRLSSPTVHGELGRCASPENPKRLGGFGLAASKPWPEAVAARHAQRRHSDPGKDVKLVVTGAEGKALQPAECCPALAAAWTALESHFDRSPSSGRQLSSAGDFPVAAGSPSGCSETTLLPGSGDETGRHVRFRTRVSECEVSTPYAMAYGGDHPMDFDFDRFGQKVFRVPAHEAPDRFCMGPA
eukprot:TRINITY_DN9916_c0_g3_i1.p1 TRINITY_DN9916_c0_g3~~TRINITY_DN9916_c0_g3_i1.p1  ORF type:complete len:207 (+),score=30.32 TRINITY_DN9916_c0_g3_i1:24-623(+)